MGSTYQAHISKFTSDIVVNGTNKIDVSITFTDKQSGNYDSELYVELGSKYFYKYLSSTSPQTISFTIPVEWLAEIPNSPVGTGKIRLQCVDMNTADYAYIETKSFTVYVPEEFKPEVSDFHIIMEDIQRNRVDYAVYGLTRPNVMAMVTPHSTSPIKKWTLSGGGVVASGLNPTLSDGDTIYNFYQTGELIKTWASTKFKLTVEDGRGRTASIESEDFYVYAYNRPIVKSLSAYRTDKDGLTKADGDYIKITVDGAISPIRDSNGAECNTLTCFINWEDTNGTSGHASITNNEPYSFAANKDLSVEIKCTLRDKYMETTALAHVTGNANDFNIAEGGGGAAIGMKATKDYFDVVHNTRLQKGLSAKETISTDKGIVSYGIGSRGDFLTFGYAEPLMTYSTPGGTTYWADFNECTSVGIWGVYSDADVSSSNYKKVLNCPCEKAGTLRVYYATGDITVNSTEKYLMQEYVVYDGSAVYRRLLSKVRDSEAVEWPENWTFGEWKCFIAADDYIVERGTSGIWTYEKWASGKAVCYGNKEYTTTISSTWGTWFVSDAFYETFPFEFDSVPILQCFVSGGTACSICNDSGTSITTKKTGNLFLCRPNASDATVTVSFYAIGQLK